MKSILELKTNILELTNGRSELDSLEDELPLTIYLVIQSNINNISSEVSIIEDYFKYSSDCLDKESKILTNIKGAIQFIICFWKFE